MSREKQIEEMAKAIHEVENLEWLEDTLAEHLYNAGYRKQSEGEWIGRRYNFDDDFPILEKSHYLRCNKCGHLHALYIYNPFLDRVKLVNVFDEGVTIPKYCPNCGAEMTRKEDEGK